MGLKIPILHSDIFNSTTKTPAELVSEVPREYFLVVAPSLITMSDSKSNLGSDIEIANKYIHNANLRKSIKGELQKEKPLKSLLTGYAVYNLMELYYSVEFNDDLPIEGNQNAIDESLWAAVFMLNEEFVLKSDKEANIIEELDADAQTKVMYHVMTNINLFDITDYNEKEVIISQVVKSIQFFQFLVNDKKYDLYVDIFYKLAIVTTWEDYLKSKLLLVLQVLGQNNKTFHQVNVTKDENFESSIRFLDSISYDRTAAGQSLPDFVGIRSKPIIKMTEGSYRVISKLFLLENLYKSLKFYFTQNVHSAMKPKDQLKGLYTLFTGSFAEDIVLYSALRNVFTKNWTAFSGTDFLGTGYNTGEPDFYVRRSKTAILFESKDVVLTGAIKQSMDHTQIIQGLRDKFNKKKKNGGGVGILQIIENCKRLKQKYYSNLDSKYNAEKLIIYPVLIVHDRMFDTPGVNRFLVNEFNNELAAVPDEFTKEDVRPLTVINIDTLITYGEAIRDSGKDLSYFLDAYVISYTKFKKMDKRMSGEDCLMQTFLPFSKFLQNRLLSMNINKMPSVILEYASFLFPK